MASLNRVCAARRSVSVANVAPLSTARFYLGINFTSPEAQRWSEKEREGQSINVHRDWKKNNGMAHAA